MAAPHAPTVEHAAEAAAGHGTQAAAPGAEHAGAFPPFDAATFASQLFWFVLTFAALYFVLSRLVLPRIAAVQARRAATLANDREGAAEKTAAAERAREAMEQAVAKARADARTMIDGVRAKAQAELAAEQAEAEKRLSDRIAAADAKIDQARVKALADVGAVADSLAAEVADKLAPAPARAMAGE